MPKPLRALIYRPGSLGDTLVSLPALAEIRRRYPEHRLTLLTEKIDADSPRVSPWAILRDTGWFDDARFYVVHAATASDCAHNAALAWRLRAIGYDDVFSLAPPRTARQLEYDAWIFKRVIGARRYHAAAAPAWPPSDTAGVPHEALRLLRIVNPDASGDFADTFRLPLPMHEQAFSARLLDQLGVSSGDVLVGVAPGSARSATAWPIERFAAVGDALLRQFRNLTLLAIGGEQERTLCERLCSSWGPRSRNLAGRLSVIGSASVLSRCATFIGNDSGPMHLAAVVGIPCVAIFSARNAPGQWTPLGPQHVVLEDRPECAGCMLDDCVLESKKCLLRIPITRVVREAASLIELRAAAQVS
jgi:ADP-heptose:LPS heptosyltransferase